MGRMAIFDASTYARRRKYSAELARVHGLAGLIIGTGSEFAYLTGSWASSHERLTALTISADGNVRLTAPMTDIGALAELAADDVELIGWRDGEDPYAIATAPLDAAGQVGLGTSLSAAHVFALQELLPNTTLAADAAAELFMVKDEAELAELERAGAAIDRVHERAPELLRPGRTEREVAGELHELILQEHARVEFVIVGSGPNGSNPHHDFSDRVLQPGDPVVVDLGGALDSGYQSDCTRTHVVAGEQPPEDFSRAYAALTDAFNAACEAARPGITAGELDTAARDVLEAAGYGELFTHRLGHGIGLAGHEAPFIIGGSDVELREGMAFSIEPGLYKPGEWGMRIEDIVTLTDRGVRTLNHTDRGV